uniref:Capsule gland specific secretory protein n=1 Tax=Reishia bronni TaxID=578817 RepID=A0A6G9KPB9_9CAEN|nr:capsule gland specific secretory protein [Reishia bronni]
MIGLYVVVLFLSAAHAQYLAECPPENIEVATFRLMTRDFPPLSIPNENRMEKDRSYAVAELQTALADVPDFGEKLQLPENYLTDPFVERCCEKPKYNCSSISIELRYVKYQDGICWIVWPADFFVYTRCTCCTCLLDDDCPVVGRCVETEYVTIKVIAYCFHIMYSDRFQKLAIRIPTACECAASCPVPQNYFYKKAKMVW